MKIGVDIHGTVDAYPKEFKQLTQQWLNAGHQIHIVTGQSWMEVIGEIYESQIYFTHHFSIVDHHRTIGTRMWDNDSRGSGWWMDRETWIRSKGIYARQVGLDIHFDDEKAYAEHFPAECKFIIVPPEGFIDIDKIFEDLS